MKLVSVTLDRKVKKWIDAQVETDAFASRFHAIEFCCELLRESIENKQPIDASKLILFKDFPASALLGTWK